MDRKGISPVIAVLLLVIIAVAAAILTYLWVLGYMGTVQQQGTTEALQERIKIDSIETSGGTLSKVYVRNTGDVNVTVNSVYIADSTGEATCIYSGEGKEIAPGEVIGISVSYSLTPGRTYVVKAVTTSGVEATYTFTFKK